MNRNDFEALMYILWCIIIKCFKFDTIYKCIKIITEKDILSLLCTLTYFIFLSKSEWDYLYKFSMPIVFWSVVFRNQ